MQYLLMLYVDEAGWPKLSKAEQEQGVAAYTAYAEALAGVGVLKGANRLRPTSSATSRGRDASFPAPPGGRGGRPSPAPTERSVQIFRTTLFRSWFTA